MMGMQLPDINLDAISDPAARQIIGHLLNVIETLHAEVVQLHAENQQLRDELARLKGGPGKPDVKPPTPPAPPHDHSSERERHTPTPRQKGRKLGILVPTRTERCVVDRATLPPDAIRHDTTEVIVQDLILQPEIIRFGREVWYLPSTGATITAPLPDGYHGEFGPHIQALTLTLGHGANVSQPSLLTFFQDAGIAIGKGTIARWLRDYRTTWRADAQAIHQAGLASTDWQATDQTSTRVDGQNETCHVLGNPFFTVYQTRPGGTRQDVLAVLWGQEPRFRLNADTLAWLDATRISQALLTQLCAALPWATDLSAADLTRHLDGAGVTLGPQQRQQVWDALAVAAYHAQTALPIVRRLLSDDAAVYHLLTDEHALCWIHDARHYAKLTPSSRSIATCWPPSGRTTGPSIASWLPIGRRQPNRNAPGCGPGSTSCSAGARATWRSLNGWRKPGPTANCCCWCSTIPICRCITTIWNWRRADGYANAMSVSARNPAQGRRPGTPSKRSSPAPPNWVCGCMPISSGGSGRRPPH